MKGYAELLVLGLFINPHAQRKRGRVISVGVYVIGEQSEPPSDKLGGEKKLASHELVCLSIYIYVRTA